MTYCVEQTKLLQRAGKEIAEKFLPEPFKLWYSSHDTGCQMTIVVKTEDREFLYVWRGSLWYNSIYEFNDRGHVGGLQPDFAFAQPVIDKYFEDIQNAVAESDSAWEAAKAKREAVAQAAKEKAIAGVRAALVHGE